MSGIVICSLSFASGNCYAVVIYSLRSCHKKYNVFTQVTHNEVVQLTLAKQVYDTNEVST